MSREKAVVVAAALLVAYTLALSLVGPIYLAGAKKDKSGNKLGTNGAVKAQGPLVVYSDLGGTTQLSSIDWGIFDPGESKNVTSYIKNWGSSPLALSFSTENWNPPSASQYLTLNWNYTGQPLRPTEAVTMVFNLTVSGNVSALTNFSFDIIIVGNSV